MTRLRRVSCLLALGCGLATAPIAFAQDAPAGSEPISAEDAVSAPAGPQADIQAAEAAGVVFASISVPSVLETGGGKAPKELSCESRMAALLDNPTARTVLERHIPDVVSDPRITMARGLTLKQLAGFKKTGITQEQLTEIDQDLASATHR